MLLESTLAQPFRPESWSSLLQDIFPPGSEPLDQVPTRLDIESLPSEVSSVHQIGTLSLGDENLALLIIETGEHVHLARNRVALRNFVSKLNVLGQTDAVLAVFHQPDCPDWRATYAAKRVSIDNEGMITTSETAPRRFTFLLGSNEPVRTASTRFKQI